MIIIIDGKSYLVLILIVMEVQLLNGTGDVAAYAAGLIFYFLMLRLGRHWW